MSIQTHPKFKFKISPLTGKRLPSVKILNEQIRKTEQKLESLKIQLQEHLLEVSK